MIYSVSDAPSVGDFDRHASHYDDGARIQRWSAECLAELIATLSGLASAGEVVELAAGTGLVTSHLLRLLPDAVIHASDVSPGMVAVLADKLETGHPHRLVTEVLDATAAEAELGETSVLVCAYSLQWFADPAETVSKWLSALPSGALCFLSWPGRDSFPQWKQVCEQSQVAFTGNPLPGPDLVDEILSRSSGAELLYHARESVILHFEGALDFFRSMRDVGAGAEMQSTEERRNLLRIVRLWDRQSPGGVDVTHWVHFAAFRKH